MLLVMFGKVPKSARSGGFPVVVIELSSNVYGSKLSH